MRRISRYHGCLSFLEYAGYDMETDTFLFGSEELAPATPGEMQANFMHQRWGNRGEEKTMAVFGPGEGGDEPKKPVKPPTPVHVHDYENEPVRVNGKLGFPCTGANCDHVWWVDEQ